MGTDVGKSLSAPGRHTGSRGTSLTGSDAGGHGYSSADRHLRQIDDGVRLRIVLPHTLAEYVDVLAREAWMTPQEWIRQAIGDQAVYQFKRNAEARGVPMSQYAQSLLDEFRRSQGERAQV